MKIKLQPMLAVTLLLLLSCNNKKATKNNEPLLGNNVSVINDTINNEEAPRKESINLFTLETIDSSNFVLVSLSDIYPISSDSAETLNLPDIKKMGIKAAQYFTLDKKYRNKFLSETNIAETDSVFVYDYAKNKLVSFPVKNLKAAAMINAYMSEQDWPYSPYNYQIGFEISKQYLQGFSEYYSHVLVYVGKENPFAQKQLTPIVWTKISAKEYPSKPMEKEMNTYLQNLIMGNTYTYKTDSLYYFLQDYVDSSKEVYARRLLVVDSKKKDIIIEKNFRTGESLSAAPLNYQNPDNVLEQWTGNLLKNKPPVVFGFEYVSFGCPAISVIDKSNEDIYLQCDNRH